MVRTRRSILLAAALLLAAATLPFGGVAPANATTGTAIIKAVNAERAARGLAPLEPFGDNSRAAQANDHFASTGETHGTFSKVASWYHSMGVRSVAENQARFPASTASATAVARAWSDSKGHAANQFNRSATHIAAAVTPSGSSVYYTVHILEAPGRRTTTAEPAPAPAPAPKAKPKPAPAPTPAPAPDPEPPPPPPPSPEPAPQPAPAPDPEPDDEEAAPAPATRRPTPLPRVREVLLYPPARPLPRARQLLADPPPTSAAEAHDLLAAPLTVPAALGTRRPSGADPASDRSGGEVAGGSTGADRLAAAASAVPRPGSSRARIMRPVTDASAGLGFAALAALVWLLMAAPNRRFVRTARASGRRSP